MERQVAFQEYHPSHDESLIELLMNEDWPLRATTTFTREDVLESIQAGDYGGSHDLTYFVCLEDVAVGLVRLEDVESERVEPSLDIRLRERWRRQGLGVSAMCFITSEYFNRYPNAWRIEGQTRRDNTAMRKTFERAGWVLEAVYRQAWPPDATGTRRDGLGYAILRGDWELGRATPIDLSARKTRGRRGLARP